MLLDLGIRILASYLLDAGGVAACTPHTRSGIGSVCFARVLHYSAVTNPGRFGLYASQKHVLPILVGAAMIWAFSPTSPLGRLARKDLSNGQVLLMTVVLRLIAAGAVMNMGEMIVAGHVTDYIAIVLHRHTATVGGKALNIADGMLGCALLGSAAALIWSGARCVGRWCHRRRAQEWHVAD
ncbi:hypothetical protein GCM10025771_06330 [Niveibacterium umoris]|uniref:Lipoprotein signal peptidase n=1 Tax=Niveibacterium umoris TaxID=1193620 RepID=A0A840BLD4_9RHOO|nr:signal peptidase II [Niveibacterium umoris]MBB4013820.1 lipoprotein signal peptidase [Niveibacterium umoris]